MAREFRSASRYMRFGRVRPILQQAYANWSENRASHSGSPAFRNPSARRATVQYVQIGIKLRKITGLLDGGLREHRRDRHA